MGCSIRIAEGEFSILQVYYGIFIEKQKFLIDKPDTKIFRKSLFWDTEFDKIDWQKKQNGTNK